MSVIRKSKHQIFTNKSIKIVSYNKKNLLKNISNNVYEEP